jgi:hypothetical protein
LSFIALARELLMAAQALLAPPTVLMVLIVLPFKRLIQATTAWKTESGVVILENAGHRSISALYRV